MDENNKVEVLEAPHSTSTDEQSGNDHVQTLNLNQPNSTAEKEVNKEAATNMPSQGKQDEPHQPSDAAQVTGIRFIFLMVSVLLGVLMIAFNGTALSTAIPSITNEFHTVDDVGWYVSSFLIANCALSPFTGTLYKLFPIKMILLVFIFIFEIGSLIAALAKVSAMLVVGRAIQGVGSAGLLSGFQAIIIAAVPIGRRASINGVLMGGFAFFQALGPILGGALTEVTWRWCFWINLPIGGLNLLLFAFFVPLPMLASTKSEASFLAKLSKIDWFGFVAFAAASAMFLVGIQWGGTTYPWSSANVIGMIVGGIVTFFVLGGWFVFRGEAALIQPRLLNNRINICLVLTGFFQMAGAFMALYYLPLWFQAIKGANPLMSGVMTLPLIISQLIASVVSGAVVHKTGYYLPWIVGANAFVAIGSGLMSTFTPDTTTGQWFGYSILVGIGRGIILQLLVTAIQGNVPKKDGTVATALVTFAQFMGGALFVGIAKQVFTTSIAPALEQYAPSVDPLLVINTGATDLASAVRPDQATGVLQAYNQALTHVFYLQLAVSAAALLFGCGTGWTNLKKVKEERDEEQVAQQKQAGPQVEGKEGK